MFGFLKKKSLKKIRQLSTPEGHIATITKEYLPHLLANTRYHITIFSKENKETIIHAQVIHTSAIDAEQIVNSWMQDKT